MVGLIADIGGHLGLFIGLSAATVIELIEFVLDSFLIGGCSNCRQKSQKPDNITDRPTTTPVTPIPRTIGLSNENLKNQLDSRLSTPVSQTTNRTVLSRTSPRSPPTRSPLLVSPPQSPFYSGEAGKIKKQTNLIKNTLKS